MRGRGSRIAKCGKYLLSVIGRSEAARYRLRVISCGGKIRLATRNGCPTKEKGPILTNGEQDFKRSVIVVIDNCVDCRR